MKFKKRVVAFGGAVLLVGILLLVCVKGLPVGNSEAQAKTDTTSDSLATIDISMLSLKEKVESALDEDNHLPGIDYFRDGRGVGIMVNDQRYYAGATYPADEWTLADIAKSYLDGSAPWIESWSWREGDLLWSNDYEHQFAVKKHLDEQAVHLENWLYMDGYRVWPVESPVGDISPDNLIQLYRAGEWDGRRCIFSDACPALMVDGINLSGQLVYFYDAEDMSEADISVAEDMLRSWDHVHMKEYGEKQTECFSYIYPDLPDPYSWRIENPYRRYRDSEGTYITVLEIDYSKDWARCKGARVELYRQGELKRSWDLTPEKDFWGSSESEFISAKGEQYFFYGDTLWHLLDNGSIELVMKDIVGNDCAWDETVRAFYTQSGDVAFVPPLSEEDLQSLNEETEIHQED